MKICVYGAGAVGGYLAARLLEGGRHEVSVIARGAHGRAIASHGLTLITQQRQFTVRPHAVADSAAGLPAQDLVFVTLKSHAQPGAAAGIASLLGEGGAAVFVNNGIPWWWKHRGADDAGQPLPLLDPEGSLWRLVRPERAVGCVVYSANEVASPGVVRHVANNRWLLGEPDGSLSPRLLAAADALRGAQLEAQAVDDIRGRIWDKLLRNAPLNSVCALTRLPVADLARDAQLPELCGAVVGEIAAIAAAHGCPLDDRLEAARAAIRLGGALDATSGASVRPSMLQDALAGRRMEVQSILGQVRAFARETGTPCPTLDLLLALVRGLDLALAQPAA